MPSLSRAGPPPDAQRVADLTAQVESLRETHQNMDMILAKLLDFTGYNSDLRELVEHLERIEQTVGSAPFDNR